jgi:hypothetical protein
LLRLPPKWERIGGEDVGERMKSDIKSPPGDGMTDAVTIELDRFVVDALAAGLSLGRERVPLVVVRALRYYLDDGRSSRTGWRYPEFLGDKRDGEGVELKLELDDALWDALEAEAVRQGVSVRQLAEHASLYYVAEVDAGRIAGRILDDLGRADDRR